jgi:hypothetical protein
MSRQKMDVSLFDDDDDRDDDGKWTSPFVYFV